MAVSAGAPRQPAAVAFRPIPFRSRILGFGSIYGKTMRDSRLSFLIAAGMFGGLALFMGAAISQVFPTPQARQEVDKLIGSMPASMVNLFGKPVGLGTLGGYMTWKYGALFTLGAALWSILALTGALAGEARRGSLEFVAVTTFGKRRIALEKLFAHLTVVGLSLVIVAVAVTYSSNAFGDVALGDAIPPLGAIGFAVWIGAFALFFGGLAFALSPVLGRGGAAGLSSVLMLLLWVANGLDVLGPVGVLSPFRWMSNHIPLVGMYDWAPVVLTIVLGVALLAVGVELFARRDLGATAGLSLPSLPAGVLGVRGPISRAFGDQLPRAFAWGIGLGIFGVVLASLVGPFAKQIGGDTTLSGTFGSIFPGLNFATAGGWLQLYLQLFYIAAGFAGATFVSKWASDETDGRLEAVLATPLARARWVVAGGLAALLAILLMCVMFAAGIAIGAAAGGGEAGTAVVGSLALGLFAAAMVGVGVAVGGLWRTSLAAEIVALVVVATYLVDLLAPALRLPDWVHQLALSSHFGQPMLGQWDLVGVAASIVIAVGGIGLGGWGMTRRDVAR